MAASSYGEALARLLVHEGGNDDDPRDPGGRTSRGILQREWDVWRRGHPGLPADVWRAPQNQVEAIYRQNYWNALRCDDLPAGVDYAVFDYGVIDHGVLLQHVKAGGRRRDVHYSKGDLKCLLEWARTKHGDLMPIGLFIPFDQGWTAVKEFIETDGALPQNIAWIAEDDIPPDAFPDPAKPPARK
jgi:Glycosyl hydrolase 108